MGACATFTSHPPLSPTGAPSIRCSEMLSQSSSQWMELFSRHLILSRRHLQLGVLPARCFASGLVALSWCFTSFLRARLSAMLFRMRFRRRLIWTRCLDLFASSETRLTSERSLRRRTVEITRSFHMIRSAESLSTTRWRSNNRVERTAAMRFGFEGDGLQTAVIAVASALSAAVAHPCRQAS